jgi:tetratricopeptide (TPR) repeat protein
MRFLIAAFLVAGSLLQLRGDTPDQAILAIQDRITTGDLDGASRALEAALRRDPGNGGLYNLRGVIHAQHGEADAAAADFELSIRYNPALTGAYLNLGRILQMRLETGEPDFSRAIALYRKVLGIQPDSAEARFQLAHLLNRAAKSAEALAEIDRLPANVLAKPETRALRCAALAGARKFDAARLAAEELMGTDVPAGNLQEAANDFLRHKELRKEGRRMLERVAQSQPQASAPLIALARAAYEDRDLEGTLGYLAHARDLEPRSAPIHFFIGIVALELDLAVEARKSLEQAIELDSRNAFYHYALGGVLLQTGQTNDALPHFRIYTEFRPDDSRGKFALGAAEFAVGDLEHSRKEMEVAARSKETVAGSEYYLGRIAMQEDNLAEAREHFLRSIHAEPASPITLAHLGRLRIREGDLAAAATDLKRALALDPDCYMANQTLLALYQKTKDERTDTQRQRVNDLEKKRSIKQELMLRTIAVQPY